MSPRDLRLCRVIGSFALACMVTAFILGGLALHAAAQRGDLFLRCIWWIAEMKRQTYHLMCADVRRMRELEAHNLPQRAISRLAGVSTSTLRRHLGRTRGEALRIERLFASCNRVLVEVRA
ncbi:hypothetical protein GCM10025880_00680 [Methylorubrum aminovorans]|nr:hypothetical protein [Methylorubrum aminovorans]GMA73651.1 hypothetical protein GCM10025880_00680 [Methylorubrum aminovorans]